MKSIIIAIFIFSIVICPFKNSMAENNNGIMATYGDTIFSGLNGLMDTYYVEHTASEKSFNGIRTEFEPQHESLAKGLNGVMDVFDPNTGRLTAEGKKIQKQIDAPPFKFHFFYPTNGYMLSQSDISVLDESLRLIKNNEVVTLYIIGYTDPTGPKSFNQKLSERRAQQVEKWLLNNDVPKSKIKTHGAGIDEEQEDFQQARRVDLMIEFK